MSASKKRGFTLIELLVVIAIIGLLASIVLTSLASAQAKGRDAKRLATLNQLRSAVEQYANTHQHYPITNCATNNGPAYTSYDDSATKNNVICSSAGSSVNEGTLSNVLMPYIAPVHDPGNPTTGGLLYRSDDGSGYCIGDFYSPENMNDFPKNMWDPNWCSAVDSSGHCTAQTGTTGSPVPVVFLGTGQFARSCIGT